MTGATRVPFDLALPFVAAKREIIVGSKRYKRGEVIPWRDHGLTDLEMLTLYRALHVDNVEAPAVKPKPPGKVLGKLRSLVGS